MLYTAEVIVEVKKYYNVTIEADSKEQAIALLNTMPLSDLIQDCDADEHIENFEINKVKQF